MSICTVFLFFFNRIMHIDFKPKVGEQQMLALTLAIGSIIGFGLFLRMERIGLKVTAFFLTASFLIIAIVLMLTGNVKIQNRDLRDNSNLDRRVGFKEKTKSETVSYVKIKEKVLLDAPIIKQYPELPRGCEVTSLAMLLQYKGIQVGKMELAEKVTKDGTPFKKQNGKISWGNPNDGFIGNMYSFNQPGYGVYHKPIKELIEKYLSGRVVDLTGESFTQLQTYLSLNVPVWVITNTTFRKLPESAFETWQTPKGQVRITYKEHAVLITGYDSKNIYFNDPLSGTKNKAVSKQDFLEAWVQMGSQSITYLPDALK